MYKFDFENLDVYKKAVEFINKIYEIFEKMPYEIQKSIGINLMKAAMSIANNIAEGSGRRGKKEKRYFFEISQGSAFECIPILTILYKREKINVDIFNELYNDCYILSKMTSGLITHFSK